MVAGQIDSSVADSGETAPTARSSSRLGICCAVGVDGHRGVGRGVPGDLSLDAERVELSPTALRVAVTNCKTGVADHVEATRSNVYELLKATMASARRLRAGRPAWTACHTSTAASRTPSRSRRRSRSPPHGSSSWRRGRAGTARSPHSDGGPLALQLPDFPPSGPRWRSAGRATTVRSRSWRRSSASARLQVIRPSRTLPASRMTRDRGRIVETLELGRRRRRPLLPTRGLEQAALARP